MGAAGNKHKKPKDAKKAPKYEMNDAMHSSIAKGKKKNLHSLGGSSFFMMFFWLSHIFLLPLRRFYMLFSSIV